MTIFDFRITYDSFINHDATSPLLTDAEFKAHYFMVNKLYDYSYTSGVTPISFYPTGHLADRILLKQHYDNTLKLKVQVLEQRPSSKHPCIFDKVEISGDVHSNCIRQCRFKQNSMEYTKGEKTYPWFKPFGCRINGLFVGNTTEIYVEDITAAFKKSNKKCTWKNNYSELKMFACVHVCRKSKGCYEWNYNVNYVEQHLPISEPNYSYLNIYYPTPSETIIFKQVLSVTLEDFIGDLGGILGLWTGASILSVIQLIYLCISYCMRQMKNNRVEPDLEMNGSNN